MHLSPTDISTLQARAKSKARMRFVGPMVMVVDLIAAGVIFVFVERPVALYMAIALVLGGVAFNVVFRRITAPTDGDAQSVLDGRQPTASLWATALGDEGRVPWEWSLGSEPGGPSPYLHLAAPTGQDWSFETGQRYQVQGFGPQDKPYGQMVMLTKDGHGPRAWTSGIRLSEQKWNTISSG